MVARILVIDGGTGKGRDWQTRLIGLGHSVPRVVGDAANLADEVEDLEAGAVIALLPGGTSGDKGLEQIRTWRRGDRKLPLLVAAEDSSERDWTLDRDGSGLFPFAALGQTEVPDRLGDLIEPWLSSGSGEEAGLLRQAVDVLGDALLATDLAGNVTLLNREAERLTGWTAREAEGIPAREVFETGAQAGPRGAVWFRPSRGEPVAVEILEQPLERGGGGVSGTLTVLRKAGAEVGPEELRTRRLEALEHLARGFSHGFNNLLTVILGNLSLAEAVVREEVPRGMVREAIFAAKKAQNLVHQIMVFARGGAPVRGLVPLGPLLRQIVQERRPDHPGLEYELALEPLETVVRADTRQLRRLVENLLENAEQASGGSGSIGLRCHAEGAPSGLPGWLVIEVSDQGTGMDETVREQAFEPFFSTRQVFNATGLGLTVCEAIARAHGGSISLRSEPEKGTVATVRLPMDAPASREAAAGNSGPAIRRGHAPRSGGRILVLEDESLIRRLIQTTLAQAGHRIDEARDGEAAVDAYRVALEAGEPYDLLIMDLVIEDGMGGVEALQRIREMDAAACAIVSSGYSDDPAMAEPERFGFSGVLPKPYQPVELIDAVEAMLARLRETGGRG